MNCEECVRLMSDFLDGSLSLTDKTLWEKHFGHCPACVTFFRSFKSSVELVSYLEEQRCPKDVENTLHDIITERANMTGRAEA
ncbi:MAG: zf-HC2 domain-containing protein [Spirochaetia bacterium]|nr:zf-HC2 domain-containing protein [Spirochaetia bacterium]